MQATISIVTKLMMALPIVSLGFPPGIPRQPTAKTETVIIPVVIFNNGGRPRSLLASNTAAKTTKSLTNKNAKGHEEGILECNGFGKDGVEIVAPLDADEQCSRTLHNVTSLYRIRKELYPCSLGIVRTFPLEILLYAWRVIGLVLVVQRRRRRRYETATAELPIQGVGGHDPMVYLKHGAGAVGEPVSSLRLLSVSEYRAEGTQASSNGSGIWDQEIGRPAATWENVRNLGVRWGGGGLKLPHSIPKGVEPPT